MNNDMLIKKINEESDNQTELFDSNTINDTNSHYLLGLFISVIILLRIIINDFVSSSAS